MQITRSELDVRSEVLQSRHETQQKAAGMSFRPASPGAAATQVVVSQQAYYAFDQARSLSFSSTSEVQDGDHVLIHALSTLASSSTRYALEGQAALTFIHQQNPHSDAPTLRGSVTASYSSFVFQQVDQSLRVTMQGRLQDADGREVKFSLVLAQDIHERQQQNQALSIVQRPLTDPLILNFGTDVTTLTDLAFQFDLNYDGQAESLAAPGVGSGFLVFDRNQDGLVNDGSEMFGASTGNGFAELAAHDADGNGWIDASDPIFSQLQVMVVGPEGSTLHRLAELGVGAIGLQSASSRLSLTSAQGTLLGEVKRSGVLVMENGAVRTVQELDFAEQTSPALATSAAPWQDGQVLMRIPAVPAPAQGSGENVKEAFTGQIRDVLAKLDAMRRDMQAGATGKAEKPPKSLVERMLETLYEQQREFFKQQTASKRYQGVRSTDSR